jgi:Putative sensor
MNTATIRSSEPLRSGGVIPWLRAGFVASARGLALIGLVVAEAVAWALLICALVLVPLGVGLFLLPMTLRAVRRLAGLFRRLAMEWAGVRIPVPYRPAPTPMTGRWDGASAVRGC